MLIPRAMNKKHAIDVDAVANYLESQSAPEAGRYVFAYTVTLVNSGAVAARLLSRHWLITDGNGKIQEVRGDGVVGEQPHLLPGEAFRYTSATMIETPVGTMQGEYQMIADDGHRFDAAIRPFVLAMPRVLH